MNSNQYETIEAMTERTEKLKNLGGIVNSYLSSLNYEYTKSNGNTMEHTLILDDLFNRGGAENVMGSISLIIDDLEHISNLLMDILEEEDDGEDYESLDKLERSGNNEA